MSIASGFARSSRVAGSRRRFAPAILAWAFAVLSAICATGGNGATLVYSVLVDADNDASTGCSVSTAGGPFAGVEQLFATTVVTSSTGAAVTGITRSLCSGGTLGAPSAFSTGGWPVGIGNGVAAMSVIESYVPLSMLPASGVIRIAVTSSDGAGAADVISIAAGGPLLVALASGRSDAAPIPTVDPLGLALLAGLLAASGVWLGRRRYAGTLSLAILALTLSGMTLVWAATVILDGEIGDWAGIGPLAVGTSGDAAPNADLVAVFVQRDGTNLYVRIDADVRADAGPANKAPIVDAGPDQAITLPAGASLAGSVSDDGLPNPPGVVTATWSKISGPGTVTFANAGAPSTTATFGSAGTYVLRLTGDDSASSAADEVTITVDPAVPGNTAPTVNAGPDQTITLPAGANVSGTASDDGLPAPPGAITLGWSKVSGPGTVTFGNATAAVTTATFSVEGIYVLRLTVSDGALSTSDDVQVTVNASSGLPPDPATVATPLDPAVATGLASATAFLYTGSNPIQTGVAPGTIEDRRAAVLRGVVRGADDAPLADVTITVLGHPEFGQTRSRADGRFDLAVNGGGTLTIDYAKSGYLPVQRQIQVPWQDYAELPAVVMIAPDSRVTTIDLGPTAPIQVARGNPVVDADGSRQATVMFPSGTGATMLLPDGSTRPLTSLGFRATEYTVGPSGPARMPAALPPTSGYTYAVELSADEAIAAGARSVVFSQPVLNYVENFVGFPVGTIVPSGYYDRERGAWTASENGRVVRITAVSGGAAVVDTVGTRGLPPVALSLEERQQLALLYPVGQELWRVPISHFTSTDHNWPVGLPADAIDPPAENPETDVPGDDPCLQTGSSVVECESQILGEAIRVPGTPFALHYRSNRVPGRAAAFKLDIPISGASVPASLRRIELEIAVAGRRFAQTYAPAASLRHTFVWDGRDAYGREVQGAAEAVVRVGYVYGAVYQEAGITFAQSFGLVSGITLSVARAVGEITSWRESRQVVGTLRAQVGGWSLDAHHAYDPVSRRIYEGTGSRRDGPAIGTVVTTVAGNGTAFPLVGDGGPAIQASLAYPIDVALAADGAYYVVAQAAHRIRRVGPDGVIATVVGTGTAGFGGDGGPATAALLNNPSGVAVAPDGSLYIADTSNHRIRRVAGGIITTVAGTGAGGFSGDGGPATEAALYNPYAIAVAPDGSIYIADTYNNRVRRVGTDGVITTLAGTGVYFSDGDGGPASRAALGQPAGVAVGPDGSVYVVDRRGTSVRRIGTNGVIKTIAGTIIPFGTPEPGGGEAIQATKAHLPFDLVDPPIGIAVASDGSLYIADATSMRIRRVGPDGMIRTVAGIPGGGAGGFNGDGRPALQTSLSSPRGVKVAPDGSVYFAETGSRRIRRLAAPLPGYSDVAITVPSTNGRQLFAFDANGRHLQTHSTITGAVLYRFAYDASGRLTGVSDAYGNVTTIQRDIGGQPTAIVGPYGQTTTLAVDSNGYLGQVASPAGEVVQLTHTADGLLAMLVNPRGHASSYAFDGDGRLTSATDPTGAVKTFARAGTGRDVTVTMTTALGRVTTYRAERLANGDKRRTTTDPAGKQTQVVIAQSGNQAATYPDGTTVSVTLGPDPRWGMQAPLAANVVITSPGGKVRTLTTARTVTLSDTSRPLSMTAMAETIRINGRAFVSAYDATTRTFTNTSPTGRKATLAVDLLGRPVQSQFGGLAASSLAYDPNGRLASATRGSGAGSRTTTLVYGASGFLQGITDAAGRTLTLDRDADGRTTGLTFPDGGKSLFAYDLNGNLATVRPPGGQDHVFAFTQVDRVSAHTAPVVGTENAETQFAYDLDRQPLRVTRSDGQVSAVRYDAAGRVELVDIALGDTLYGYDAGGRLASLDRELGAALAYAYDGILPTGTTWSGPIAGTVTRVYDNNFRVTSLSVNGTTAIALTYDADGLPVKAGDLSLTRDAANGSVTGTTLGTITDASTYDAFGALATYAANRSGSAVFATAFTRDALGRIATRTETIGGVTQVSAYVYDLAGRLAEVRRDGALVAAYAYDPNGNRLSRTLAGVTNTANYDAQDRLYRFGSTTYAHNANGERASKTVAGKTTSYRYDTLGNLTGATLSDATQLDYVLDGARRRVGRKLGGTLAQGFLYQDGLKPIAELDGSNNVVSRFVYATGANVPAYMIKGGATYRIVTDHLGSPRLVIDVATGAIVQRMDYDEFGNVTADTNPGFQPFGFAGGLYEPLTGLVHFGAREYDPDTGRWTAKDPIGFRGGDANLYAYVAGDPVNRVDPGGRMFGDLLDWLLAPIPLDPAGIPCTPGTDEGRLESAVRDAMGSLIDSQVDDAIMGGIGNLGALEEGGARFIGPLGTTIDAATIGAEGFIVVHESTREQRELIDTILTGETADSAYSARRYYAPTGPRPGPIPCPSSPGGAPCVR